ncbi:hypothetical protein D0S48_16620 [Psychrobacillus sp. AK 1817]|uniref:Uncharacterized protein n=1 Tax=Psychrobacillus faecigallinarum TaxID=2762235 RepID=A0ABR8REA9_9BACI|nr:MULTISPECIES: hypothetical protein [Psychrobacillus]MBD7945877.1 hypothetical protein [Psychrobacillus faecigallinarum]QEY22161.1 hypothetical protein D0S48_16620 [Psychrobacillus sp. AK 1817]
MDQIFSEQVKELEVTVSITEEYIENIMNAVLEGGQWVIHKEEQAQWVEKPAGIYQDEWAARLLLTGETLKLIDKRNENTIFLMTLDDLYNGIALIFKNGHHNGFSNTVTKTEADAIIQYSLFKKLPYLT